MRGLGRIGASCTVAIMLVASVTPRTVAAQAAPSALTPEFACTPNALPAYEPPAPPLHPLPALPLVASGGQILTHTGAPFKIAAVNWYGADGADFVPSGLDQLSLNDIATKIHHLGFNAVRMQWSNQLVECNPTITDPALVAANPALLGKTAMAVFDDAVNSLVHHGLLVILDNHMTDAEWCCANNDNNGLWWSSNQNNCLTSSTCDPVAGSTHWEDDWVTLVTRYAGVQAVAGVDLRNQPRIYAQWAGASNSPTNCPSGADCDWPRAATTMGNLLLTKNPGIGVIFVEGIDYGVNLTGAYSNPIVLNTSGHLVYEAHAYSFSDYCHPQTDSQCIASSPWYQVSNWSTVSQASFDDLLDSQWGFLALQGTAPVWLGEFGTDQPCGPDPWFLLMANYLSARDYGWSYWALNGTQENSGAAPGTQNYLGQQHPLSLLTPENFGVLNTAWAGAPKEALVALLAGLAQSPAQAPGSCAADASLSITDLSNLPRVTAQGLATEIAGQGLSVSNAQYTGATDAIGRFKGGQDSINIGSGVVLSSGNAASTVGTSTTTSISTNNNAPGDNGLLSAYVGGLPTYDASELQFDFVPSTPTIALTYVFGSAEYDTYNNSQYDDVAAIIVNGQNCASIPGTTDPVTVNTLNDSTLESTSNTANSQLGVANDPNYWGVRNVGTTLHGLGIPLTCSAPVTAGQTNHMIIAIADVSDAVLDSDVFIEAHSFKSTASVPLTRATAHSAEVRRAMVPRG